ncbi:MAG: hypothetical protein Q8N99_03225 [Nanoarchaeota archaeon]|nr:hypothetical protein [Nanoarchaeota archaeon]
MKKVGILYSTGKLDVLSFYSKIAPLLAGFLKNKKIASKVHISNMFFLKRGSNSRPLYIGDFSSIDDKMLKLRLNYLKDIREQLNEKQELIWEYFPPRKLSRFFYATNSERRSLSDSLNLKKHQRFRDGEGMGKPIDRIFIDINRRRHSAEDARVVAECLINIIKTDKEFNKSLKYELKVLWTGGSFHVYIMSEIKPHLLRPAKLFFAYLTYFNM